MSSGEYARYGYVRGRRPRRDLTSWILTSLLLSLLPFGIAAVAFRAFHEASGTYSLPSFTLIFGDGDLLLIVLSVTGATLAELAANPAHLERDLKLIGLTISLCAAISAITVFTMVLYSRLTSSDLPFDRGFVAILSGTLLTSVVVIQTSTVLTRPQRRT
jgi:uncharacterized membrane protein YidH (DUF202 family)